MSLLIGLGLGLGGRAGAAASATYDPAVLALTIWSKDDYGGVPWAGTASAGTSGSNPFSSSGGTAPVAGTAVDGGTPAAFGGSGAGYLINLADTSIWAAGAGSIVVLCKPTTGLADPANTILARGIVGCDGAGVFQMGFSDAGLRVSVYDGAYKETPAIAAATSTWHAFAARYNGSAVQASKNASAFASNSTAAGGASRVGAAVRVGSNFDNSKEFIGDVMQIIMADFAISDAENASIYSYWKATYPSMSLP